MRKVHLVLVGLLAMSSTLVAAVPQGHSSAAPAVLAPVAVASSANATTAPTATPLTLAEVFSPATPDASTACNLLCIQGYYCCVVHNEPTCIPQTEKCP